MDTSLLCKNAPTTADALKEKGQQGNFHDTAQNYRETFK
jgi:hypothetical protein